MISDLDPLQLVALRIETREALKARWTGYGTLPAFAVEEFLASGERLLMDIPSLELMQTYFEEMSPPLVWLAVGPAESRAAVIAALTVRAKHAPDPLHWVVAPPMPTLQ